MVIPSLQKHLSVRMWRKRAESVWCELANTQSSPPLAGRTLGRTQAVGKTHSPLQDTCTTNLSTTQRDKVGLRLLCF